ncbi:MAG: DinB family protein [Phycisphaerales bacterium]|nr:DinB family protein [Phycisphaerales bacterium]
MPLSFIERFRNWYEYERDCNAKILSMLASVPEASRDQPGFERAVGKAAHLAAARQNWLWRLGQYPEGAGGSFPPWTLDELPRRFAAIETAWTKYLAGLSEPDLERDFMWHGLDGKWRRWRLLDLLTQVHGHAWYHRGQIALLVKDLGGTPVDTDYIFWAKPTEIPPPSA